MVANAIPGERRVIGWASGPDGTIAAGLPGALVWRTGGEWHHLPWDRVEHGQWDAEKGVLHVRGIDGAEHRLEVDDAHALAQLMFERVNATMLVQGMVRLGAHRGVAITGRRPLEGPVALRWDVRYPDERAEADAVVRLRVEAELERLRGEYDF